MLDVPHELVEHVSWLLYEQHWKLNTRWRKLGCYKQALLALVHLRKNETFSQLGASFGISQTTAWRYVDEILDVLASWAPGLHEALTGLGEGDFAIVDGTLLPTDRVKADETAARAHGIVQASLTRQILVLADRSAFAHSAFLLDQIAHKPYCTWPHSSKHRSWHRRAASPRAPRSAGQNWPGAPTAATPIV